MRKELKKVKDDGARPINRLSGRVAGLLMAVMLFLSFSGIAFSLAPVDEIGYYEGSRRDPFEPLVGPNGVMTRKVETADLIVEGIITNAAGASIAVISGELYQAGESIGEARILSVSPDRVIVVQDGEEQVILLREEPNK